MVRYEIKTDSSNTQFIKKTDENGKQYGIPFDPANTDYQAFLRWCDEGNVPEPADEVTE
jgi:hypothetical protein